MPALANSPVEDSVPKIKDEVAVGEDIAFQRRWWIFERITWVLFAIILIATVLGCFGRGYLAKARMNSADNLITAKYDRIQRTGTPSDITIQLGGGAVRNGEVRLSVSESLVSKLGNQRISPQPERTLLSDQGLTYIFSVVNSPTKVIFSVEPSGPGKFPFTLSLPDTGSSVQTQIYVVP